MDRLRVAVERILRSSTAAGLVCLAGLLSVLHEPSLERWIVAALALVWTLLALVARHRTSGGARVSLSQWLLLVVLIGAVALSARLVRTAAHDDATWTLRAADHLDAATAEVVDTMVRLRADAERRARLAADDPGSLLSLDAPIAFAGTQRAVGVSIWDDGLMLDWVGSVPGPFRVGAPGDALIVDHGYRRYLTVAAAADDGRVAYVDVDLGLTRDLFPHLDAGDEPGVPLSTATGLDVTVLAEPPDPSWVGRRLDRVLGVPEDEPWVWIGLRAPRPSEEQREQMEAAGRHTAWALLVALLVTAWTAWRRWPSGWLDPGRVAATLGAVAIIVALRWLMDWAELLELGFGQNEGFLRPLLDEAYFVTTSFFGLLRTTLRFLVTGLTVTAVALLLLPAWLQFLQGPAPTWRRGLGGAVLVVASVANVYLVREMQAMVAPSANATLIGFDAPFFTVAFVGLHVAMMLTLLAPTAWVILGWERWLRGGGPLTKTTLAAAVLILASREFASGASAVTFPWGPILPLLGAFLQPALREASFARRVLAALLAVLWFAGLQSQGLERVYTELKEQEAQREGEIRLNPEDESRRFLLEGILLEWAADRPLLAELSDPQSERSNLVFEMWAESDLARVGYAARLELRDRDGRLLSEFDLRMPYEPQSLHTWRTGNGTGDEDASTWVETVELSTEQGPFLVYRGHLDLSGLVPTGDAARLVVDLPYASADPSTNFDRRPTGPAVLGFPRRGEYVPRPTFESGVLVGRIEEERVEAASDPRLLELDEAQLAQLSMWRTIDLEGSPHRVKRVDGRGDSLVVAFPLPTVVERVLDASRLAALYLLVGLGSLLLLGLVRLLRLGPRGPWPTVLGEFGFQERLLGAILLVVLLPVIVSGVVQQRRAAERLRQDNLDEVAERLDTALQLLANSVDDLAAALIGGEYVQDILFQGNTVAPRQVGPFELNQLMVFSPDDELLLDETLSDLTPEAALDRLRGLMGGQLVLESDADFAGGLSGEPRWFLGRLYPVIGAENRTYHVYVRRAVSDEDLARLARVVRADLTLFDGSWAALSSQDYLYKAGLLAPSLPTSAARVILMGGGLRTVEARQVEGLEIANGYVGVGGAYAEVRGVLAARLFARATEAAQVQRRAQLFLFGLSSLALVLAVGVGLLVAARIVDPIRTLVSATRRIGGGDLRVRLPETGSDEIGQLIRSFNQMTERLDSSQRQLAARRSFLEAMLGNLSAGVMVLGPEQTVTESNAAVERLLGDRQEELLERVRQMGPPREVVDTEVSLPSSEGPRTLRLVVTPIQLESGSAGWLVLFDDVTELLASRRLSLYAQMARQVAHEVKNPLTPIQLSAQMVRQACQDDHPRMREIVEENVSQIEGQVQRLRDIASEFSLMGQEQMPDLESLPLVPLLQEVRSLYPSPDGSLGVELEVEGDPHVLASRKALLKVLTNLVENALQAMGGAGTVRIEAGVDGAQARIEVRDEGPGIPEEVEDRLFEPYFSTKSTGTGLGLVICRNLMEKMGGSIALGNRPEGRGAMAILTLGLAPDPVGNDS